MKFYIGIDVGKHHLDICQADKSLRIGNNAHEISNYIEELTAAFAKNSSICIVFEATGGYERTLRFALQKQSINYHMAHPNKARALAKAKGLLAKTDKIDAALIRHYSELMQVGPDMPELDPISKELLSRREQLISERNREKMRVDKGYSQQVSDSIKNHITWLTEEITLIEGQLDLANKQKSESIALLQYIPGVGLLTAYYLLAYLPEIYSANGKQLAALVGLAPINRDSGSYRGKRFIQGGRAPLRKALYMSAVPGVRCNPDLKRFYAHLRAKGKSAKVALVAVMRKIVLLAACVLKRRAPWVNLTANTLT